MNEFLQIVSIYYGLGCIVVIGGAFVFLVAPFFYYTAGWKCKRDLYGIVGIIALLVISFLAAIACAGPDGPPHLIPTKPGPQQEAIIERAEQRADASGYPRGSEIWQRIYNASFYLPPPQTADETAKIEQRKQAEADLQSGCYKMAADCTPEELAYVNRIDAEQAAEKANAAEARGSRLAARGIIEIDSPQWKAMQEDNRAWYYARQKAWLATQQDQDPLAPIIYVTP